MLILPTVLSVAKEQYSNFFVHLVSLYLRGTTLRFAIVDQNITFGGIEFIAFPVKISAIKSTVDSKRDNVDITISDCTNAFKVALLSGADFRGSKLEIIKISYPESLTDSTAYNIEFFGELDSPKIDDATSTFTCTARDVMSNYQCGRSLMLSCNAIFGDTEDCGATKATSTGTVSAGSTSTHINIQGTHTVDTWKYGIITIGNQSIFIIGNTGTQIITEFPFYSLPTGVYTLESGCSKNKTWCNSRYGNGASFGGFPAIPWELKVIT